MDETIYNATNWAKGEECCPIRQIDVFLLGEYLDINIPTQFYKFIESSNRNSVIVTGAEKTIYKTLDKIADKLIKDELCSEKT